MDISSAPLERAAAAATTGRSAIAPLSDTPSSSNEYRRGWAAFEHAAAKVGIIAAIGSLSWKMIPGTRYLTAATIEGFRKDFNTRVTQCRGTEAVPGLVLGLEPDGRAIADAVLLEVLPAAAHAVWNEFRTRELRIVGYVPTLVPVRRRDTGEMLLAAAVLADTRSPTYLRATPAEQASIIRQAVGSCGTNLDYARRCLGADRTIHGDLPQHLASLETHLMLQ